MRTIIRGLIGFLALVIALVAVLVFVWDYAGDPALPTEAHPTEAHPTEGHPTEASQALTDPPPKQVVPARPTEAHPTEASQALTDPFPKQVVPPPATVPLEELLDLAKRAVKKWDGSGATGRFADDNRLGRLELCEGGIDVVREMNFLVYCVGDRDGYLTPEELYEASKRGIVRIDDSLGICFTPHGQAISKSDSTQEMACRIVAEWDGSGAEGPFKNDRRLGRMELEAAGIEELSERDFIVHGVGNGDVFLTAEELCEACKKGILEIGEDLEIHFTPRGRSLSQLPLPEARALLYPRRGDTPEQTPEPVEKF